MSLKELNSTQNEFVSKERDRYDSIAQADLERQPALDEAAPGWHPKIAPLPRRCLSFLKLVFVFVACVVCYLAGSGRFFRAAAIVPSSTADVVAHRTPRIIHQKAASREVTGDEKVWRDRCMELHPDWEFKLWTDEDSRELVKERYPWFLEKYDSYDRNIMRYDAVRPLYIHAFGGVYMDMDFQCLKSLEPLAAYGKPVFGLQLPNRDQGGVLANGFMMAPPGLPLFLDLIRGMQAIPATQTDVGFATGPYFLTGHLNKYYKSEECLSMDPHGFDPAKPPPEINHYCGVLELKMPLILTHVYGESDPAKMCSREDTVDQCRKKFPSAYLTHYFAGSWLHSDN